MERLSDAGLYYAIFRCAVALGADAIVLTESCADPPYRRAARVSMGSVFKTKWTIVKSDITGILREYGLSVLPEA